MPFGFDTVEPGPSLPPGYIDVGDGPQWSGPENKRLLIDPWNPVAAQFPNARATRDDVRAAFDSLPASERAIYEAAGLPIEAYYIANGSPVSPGNVANTLAWFDAIKQTPSYNETGNFGEVFGDFAKTFGPFIAAPALGAYFAGGAVTSAGAVVDSAALSGVDAGWELAGAGSGSAGSFGAASYSLGEGAASLSVLEAAKLAKDAYSTAKTVNKLLGGSDTKGLAAQSYRGGSVPQGLGGIVVVPQGENPAQAPKQAPAQTSAGFDWNAVALVGLIGLGVYLWSKK